MRRPNLSTLYIKQDPFSPHLLCHKVQDPSNTAPNIAGPGIDPMSLIRIHWIPIARDLSEDLTHLTVAEIFIALIENMRNMTTKKSTMKRGMRRQEGWPHV